MELLEVKNVSVKYGIAPALRNISAKLGHEKVVVLLGPNGAGKSTFIKSLIGLVKIYEGEIFYRGERIDDLPVHKRARRGISLVPEGRRVFANMSVMENLYLGGYQRLKKEIETELENTVKIFFPRLIERRRQIAGTLSGGEQQMLAIARAIMSGARLVLLDEPSLGLAPIMVKQVAQVISRLNKEKKVSMIMVEQNANLGFQIADYVYVIEGGRVRLEGTNEELSKSEKIIHAYIGVE